VKLKSLEEYEQEKWKEIYSQSKNNGTGIACPQCGDELIESMPVTLLCSDPPRKSVKCEVCNFNGSILA